jgi:hypothetical protein
VLWRATEFWKTVDWTEERSLAGQGLKLYAVSRYGGIRCHVILDGIAVAIESQSGTDGCCKHRSALAPKQDDHDIHHVGQQYV